MACSTKQYKNASSCYENRRGRSPLARSLGPSHQKSECERRSPEPAHAGFHLTITICLLGRHVKPTIVQRYLTIVLRTKVELVVTHVNFATNFRHAGRHIDRRGRVEHRVSLYRILSTHAQLVNHQNELSKCHETVPPPSAKVTLHIIWLHASANCRSVSRETRQMDMDKKTRLATMGVFFLVGSGIMGNSPIQ